MPPTVDVEALEVKRAAPAAQVAVDVGFWGGAVPGNLRELRALHEAGVFGFKCFLLALGRRGVPAAAAGRARAGARRDRRARGAADRARRGRRGDRPRAERRRHRYADFLASRPRGAENLAIAWLVERARWTGPRVHVLHLSSSDALPMLAVGPARRGAVTVETCPHYLTFTAE